MVDIGASTVDGRQPIASCRQKKSRDAGVPRKHSGGGGQALRWSEPKMMAYWCCSHPKSKKKSPQNRRHSDSGGKTLFSSPACRYDRTLFLSPSLTERSIADWCLEMGQHRRVGPKQTHKLPWRTIGGLILQPWVQKLLICLGLNLRARFGRGN